MNARQAAFFRQAESDWLAFSHLRLRYSGWQRFWCRIVGVHLQTFPVCHELHYLQMCTEKLSKAYYKTDLRTGHAAFRRFLTDLPANPTALAPLRFGSPADLTRWQGSVKPIVDAIEDLAPSIADAKNLPNPEYPWPRNNPTTAPVDYPFAVEVFNLVDSQSVSGEPPFLNILALMVDTMKAHAWHL